MISFGPAQEQKNNNKSSELVELVEPPSCTSHISRSSNKKIEDLFFCGNNNSYGQLNLVTSRGFNL